MSDRPAPIPNPDYSKIVEYVEDGMKSILENDGYPGKDFDHYCFEVVMETIYGPDVWKWWNAHANY